MSQDWTGKYREFHQHCGRSTAPRVWGISVEGNTVKTTWGQMNGAMQTANEIFEGINQGKKNEKNGEQYALERASEVVRKKLREGYLEFDLLTSTYAKAQDVTKVIDFSVQLPDSLCFWKPDNSMGAGLEKKARAGNVWYVRKRNGMMFVIVCDVNGEIQIYSRRMLRQQDDEVSTQFTWNDRFPHIVEAAKKLLPPCSIVLGELIKNREGKESFEHVQSVTKSLTYQAIQKQKTDGWVDYCIWDIAWWRGNDYVSQLPLRSRYELIHELDYQNSPLLPVEVFIDYFKSPEEAVEYAKLNQFEGWVVVDPDGVFEDRAYNFKGKPDRPGSFAAKLKPEYEDDFIVFFNPDKEQGEFSRKERYAGDESPGIKSVALYQLNRDSQPIYISNCSSGMTEEMKRDWVSPRLWPQVWRVAYSGRRYVSEGDDTNALDFARFREVRSDKKTWECINPRL